MIQLSCFLSISLLLYQEELSNGGYEVSELPRGSCEIGARTELKAVGFLASLTLEVCVDPVHHPKDMQTMSFENVIVVESLPVPMHLHINMKALRRIRITMDMDSMLSKERFPPAYRDHPWWDSEVDLVPGTRRSPPGNSSRPL